MEVQNLNINPRSIKIRHVEILDSFLGFMFSTISNESELSVCAFPAKAKTIVISIQAINKARKICCLDLNRVRRYLESINFASVISPFCEKTSLSRASDIFLGKFFTIILDLEFLKRRQFSYID